MAIMTTTSSSSKSAPPSSTSSGPAFDPSEDEAPPSYTNPIPPAFTPDHVNDLNPEVSKKLAREARESGRDVSEYGVVGVLPNVEEGGNRRATYEIDGEGNIVSHDPLLSSSPRDLLAFLNLHLSSPPSLIVTFRGTHMERQSIINHCSTPGSHGGRRNGTNLREGRRETREVEVEDFAFQIDALDVVEKGLGKAIGGGGMRGLLYSAGGWECAYRGGGGGRKRELMPGEEERLRDTAWFGRRRRGIRLEEGEGLGLTEGSESALVGEGKKWRTPSFGERRKLDRVKQSRARQGLPQFVHPDSLVELLTNQAPNPARPPLLFQNTFLDLVENHSSIPIGLAPSHSVNASTQLVNERESRLTSVRSVIADYCSSTKVLKELKVTKEVYGWDWAVLEAALRETIQTTRYTGRLAISFKVQPQTLVIRPENNFSRVFSLHIFWKLCLWLILVYPVLLLIELIAGDRFDSIRVSFPLQRWRRLPIPQEASSSSSGMSPNTALHYARPLSTRTVPKVMGDGQGGWLYLVGTQEGEWLRRWEDAIKEAVREGKRGGSLKEEAERREDGQGVREGLKGYYD